MVTIQDADEYVSSYCVDGEDWRLLDAERKTALLNVAARDLSRAYPSHAIPDAAVYEFANALAVAFNDTNKYARQGVNSMQVSGAMFTFGSSGNADTRKLIPRTATDAINEDPANATLPKVGAGKRVLPLGLLGR